MILVITRTEEVDTTYFAYLNPDIYSLDNLYKIPEDISNYRYVIILGGDGTVLRFLQKYTKVPVIFSINFGNLGFLTTFTKEILKSASFINDLSLNQACLYKIFNRNRLLLNNLFYFINEAVITTKKRRLNKYTICIKNKIENLVIKGDSLLISTSSGSTAYNHSANGPVVLQDDVMIINIIAPNKSSFKPIVCSIYTEVKIECESGDTICIVDGIEHETDKFEVRFDGNFVQFACDTQFDSYTKIRDLLIGE